MLVCVCVSACACVCLSLCWLIIVFVCRRKLQNKVKEAEESLSTLQTKYSSLEKTKQRVANELDDVNITLENVSTLVHSHTHTHTHLHT